MDPVIAWNKESGLRCLVPELLLKKEKAYAVQTWVWALLIHTEEHLAIWWFGLFDWAVLGGLFS